MSQDVADPDELTIDQRRAITAILASKSISEAAISCRINRRTIQRWMKEECFSRVLRESEEELLTAATRRLATMLSASLDTIGELLSRADKDAVRLRAAGLVLERYFQARELADVEAQLALVLEKLEALENEKLRS